MNVSIKNSLQSELLKTRRSSASWIITSGAALIPVIMLINQLIISAKDPLQNAASGYWVRLFLKSWEMMSFFLLPMGIVLATSLIAQIEFKNNAWKQTLSTPQSLTRVFFVKLSVIFLLALRFFILLNAGIFLAAVIPSIVYEKVNSPVDSFPVFTYLKANFKFFIDCLPIIALQYFLSLHFKNFMISVGVGLGLVVASIFALFWEYGYLFPYSYITYDFMRMIGKDRIKDAIDIHLLSVAYFVLITVCSYIVFVSKSEKG